MLRAQVVSRDATHSLGAGEIRDSETLVALAAMVMAMSLKEPGIDRRWILRMSDTSGAAVVLGWQACCRFQACVAVVSA